MKQTAFTLRGFGASAIELSPEFPECVLAGLRDLYPVLGREIWIKTRGPLRELRDPRCADALRRSERFPGLGGFAARLYPTAIQSASFGILAWFATPREDGARVTLQVNIVGDESSLRKVLSCLAPRLQLDRAWVNPAGADDAPKTGWLTFVRQLPKASTTGGFIETTTGGWLITAHPEEGTSLSPAAVASRVRIARALDANETTAHPPSRGAQPGSSQPTPAFVPPAARVVPTHSAPARRPYQTAETEDLPRPAELERLIREAEPRAALAKAAQDTPQELSPSDKRFLPSLTPATNKSSTPNVDETVMLPRLQVAAAAGSGTFRDAMAPLVVPAMSVADYARFRANLRVHGEDDPRTLRVFGIASAGIKEALQAEFASRFLANPKVQTEFLAFFERYLRDLSSGDT